MLRIGICEPNSDYQKATAEIWSRVLFDVDDVAFSFYREGYQIVSEIKNGDFNVDLLIMDLLVPDVSGIQLLKYIRENNKTVTIILQSEAEELAKYGYRYEVFDFITKHSPLQEIERVINRYVSLISNDSDDSYLNISIQGYNQRIRLDNVCFFSSEGRKIKCVSDAELLEFYMKMDELEEKLEKKGFLRCHQSYLVNTRRIQGYRSGELVLDSRSVIPVSRRYRAVVKELLERFS